MKDKQVRPCQTERFCAAKETTNKSKGQPTDSKKVFANDTSHKMPLISPQRIRNFYNSVTEKQRLQLISGQKTDTAICPKKDTQMANHHQGNGHQPSPPPPPARTAIIKKESVGEVEKGEPCCKLLQPLWRTVWTLLKKLKKLPRDSVIPLLSIYMKETKPRSQAPASPCLLSCCSQHPQHGNDINVRQEMNERRRCGACKQWS